jgi:large subunit ribosomal protein L4e
MVHNNLMKNHLQPYAVSAKAGHQTSAKSWGTGRAASRIPRVSGSGTHRSGHGALGNMCRGGHMYAPTKVWRRWHRKVNINIKRYAVASALAASAIPALILARGHKIDNIREVPLVLDNALESLSSTKSALAILEIMGASPDVDRATASRGIRTGRAKLRNRRHLSRKGPLVVYLSNNGVSQAFRNLPGTEVMKVHSMNLLKLAPGGHLGRFILWTKSAIEALEDIFGTAYSQSQMNKRRYTLPRACLSNSDLTRLINSDEVQSIVKKPKKKAKTTDTLKSKNPLRNNSIMFELNPHFSTGKGSLRL